MKPEPIDDERLVAILRQEEAGAVGFHDGTLAEAQRVALDYYNGEAFGDEEDGRSQFVTRDVAEVVDHMVVAVLRAFVAGDHVVEFEGGEDAKQVTAAIQYLFLRKQSGYRILHDWLKSGLIERIGVVKTSCETEAKVMRQRGQGVTSDMLAMLQQDAEVTITHAEVDGVDESGAETFTLAGEKRTKVQVFRDYNIPVEEFLFAPRTVTEDTSAYLAHRCRKTRSELVEMGFDRAVVDDLPHDSGTDYDTRTNNRFEDEGGLSYRSISNDPASQEVLLLEEYIRVDRNADGRAELLCVHRVGSVILEASEVDAQPFVVFTPFPMPHRMVGQSLADKTMDIQRLRSVLWRQTLDNLYLTNAPRTFVHDQSIGDNTLDDLLTVRPNGIVRWKGAIPPTQSATPFAAGASVQMIEMATGERESRTGITRLNQGLDADALNKTATGTAMMMNQGAQIEEYIARNFGESLGRLFSKKLALMAGRAEPFTVNIDGKPVEVDPREWQSEMDLSIQVGLGTGRKDARMALRQMIVGLQAQATEAGLPIVGPKQLFNSAAGIVADANIGAVSDYFIDPDSEEAQAAAAEKAQAGPPVDPAVMEAQAKLQLQHDQAQADMELAQQKAQFEAQAAQADMAMRQQETATKLDIARDTAAMQADLAREKAASELDLAQQKMASEYQLAVQRLAMEERIALASSAHAASAKIETAHISANRPGGSLSE